MTDKRLAERPGTTGRFPLRRFRGSALCGAGWHGGGIAACLGCWSGCPHWGADAARAGAGLAYVFEAQVIADLAAGRLIRVLEDWCPSFEGFFLYYPSRQLMRPALRAFIDHVKGASATGW